MHPSEVRPWCAQPAGMSHGWSATESSRSLSTKPKRLPPSLPAPLCSSASTKNMQLRRWLHCKRCSCCRRRLDSKPRSDLARVWVRGIGLGLYRVKIGSGFGFGLGVGFYTRRYDLSRCLAHARSAGYLRFCSASSLIRRLKLEVGLVGAAVGGRLKLAELG